MSINLTCNQLQSKHSILFQSVDFISSSRHGVILTRRTNILFSYGSRVKGVRAAWLLCETVYIQKIVKSLYSFILICVFILVKNGAGVSVSRKGAQVHLRDGDGRKYLAIVLDDNCQYLRIHCGGKVKPHLRENNFPTMHRINGWSTTFLNRMTAQIGQRSPPKY